MRFANSPLTSGNSARCFVHRRLCCCQRDRTPHPGESNRLLSATPSEHRLWERQHHTMSGVFCWRWQDLQLPRVSLLECAFSCRNVIPARTDFARWRAINSRRLGDAKSDSNIAIGKLGVKQMRCREGSLLRSLSGQQDAFPAREVRNGPFMDEPGRFRQEIQHVRRGAVRDFESQPAVLVQVVRSLGDD